MTIPTDRPGTALLIVDVQVGVMEPSIRRDEVVANISTLVDRARAANTPVVWVMHGDDELERASHRHLMRSQPPLRRHRRRPLLRRRGRQPSE